MFRLLIILMGVITIILFLFVYLCFWVYGNMKGVVLFIIFFYSYSSIVRLWCWGVVDEINRKKNGKKAYI